MKLSRIWTTLGLAAAVLFTVPFSAQAQVIRSTAAVPGYNYVGLAGSDDGLAVNGKFSITNNISIRPEVATDFDFDDAEDVTYLVPVTYDFAVGSGRATFNPFVGGGVAGSIGDDSDVEFALIAGTDYRFARNYVANASVNYSPFADDDEVGFTAGIGYQF